MSTFSQLEIGSPVGAGKTPKARAKAALAEHLKLLVKGVSAGRVLAKYLYGAKPGHTVELTYGGRKIALTRKNYGDYKKSMVAAIKKTAKLATDITKRRQEGSRSRTGFVLPILIDSSVSTFFSRANLGNVWRLPAGVSLTEKGAVPEGVVPQQTSTRLQDVLLFLKAGQTANLVSAGTLTQLYHIYINVNNLGFAPAPGLPESEQKLRRQACQLPSQARQDMSQVLLRTVDRDLVALREQAMKSAKAQYEGNPAMAQQAVDAVMQRGQQVAQRVRAAINSAPNPQVMSGDSAVMLPDRKVFNMFDPDFLRYPHLAKITAAATVPTTPEVKEANKQFALANAAAYAEQTVNVQVSAWTDKQRKSRAAAANRPRPAARSKAGSR